MKKVYMLVAALVAVAPAPALARDPGEGHGRGHAYGHERREERREDRHDRRDDRHDRRDYRHGYREAVRDDRHYDRGRYPAYAYPRGYAYRRWAPGVILPGALYGSGYWYNDYRRFGFAAPQRGFRWVRQGPDLLLVNIRNGRVRDARYGIFR